MESRVEQVGGGVQVCIDGEHAFGTDSVLLSDFALPHSPDSPTRPRPPEMACDLGCGCGAVPLLWYREGGGPEKTWAVDIQPSAVALLRRAAALSGLEGRLYPVEGDLRRIRETLPVDAFDLVTCNPPYHGPGTGRTSGRTSDRIARHETLCTLADVCAAAEQLLRSGGRFCLCHLPERLTDVLALLRAHRMEPKRLRMVQQTASSPPWLVLVEGRRGAKPRLVVEPPLLMREGDGPSPELAHIYRYYGKV